MALSVGGAKHSAPLLVDPGVGTCLVLCVRVAQLVIGTAATAYDYIISRCLIALLKHKHGPVRLILIGYVLRHLVALAMMLSISVELAEYFLMLL